MVSNRFKKWMETTTLLRKKEVARQANSSHILFYHLATGYRNASRRDHAWSDIGSK